MTKRTRILGMLAIFGMSVVMMTSCGGGSGSVGKKLASNEFLGDLPNLVYQKAINDSIREAKEHTEKEKFKQDNSKNFDKSTGEKWKKMEEQFKTEKKAAEEQFNAEVEKLKPSFVGKELPFEVEDGCGYEVSGLKISDLNRAGTQVEFEVAITDGTVIKTQGWGTLAFYFQVLDKDGNLIGKDYSGEFRNTTINMSQKNGTTAKGSFYLVDKHDAAEMVNFAKIKFVKSK
jgi:hypothetical protein